MLKIELDIECQSCNGTGIYTGFAERDGAAVVCYKCKGTGKYRFKFSYNEFTGRKKKSGVERVYKKSYGYAFAPELINFDRIGPIDLTKEGVSYDEFLNGKMPEHIREMACPMLADQRACHNLDGFTEHCNCLGNLITKCEQYGERAKCWERFDSLKGKKNE